MESQAPRHTKVFTYEYVQPSAYSFCQDSVLAPLAIANDLEASEGWSSRNFFAYRALDVCAGCGVMGLELAHALPQIQNFEFLEIQEAFRDSFFKNLELTGHSELFRWIERPYADLQTDLFRGQYDLIVCNPPYFDLGEGTLPPDEVKQRARFFVDDTLESLLKSVHAALKPGGHAYLLMKSGKKHGRDAFTLARTLLFDCEVTKIADIRGTDLVRITSSSRSQL